VGEAFQRRRFGEAYDPAETQVIEENGDPVGALSVRRHPDGIFLASIEVSPGRQGHGIATGLIRGLCEEADAARLPVSRAGGPAPC